MKASRPRVTISRPPVRFAAGAGGSLSESASNVSKRDAGTPRQVLQRPAGLLAQTAQAFTEFVASVFRFGLQRLSGGVRGGVLRHQANSRAAAALKWRHMDS